MAYVLEPGPNGTAHVVIAVEFDASRIGFEPGGSSRSARLDVSVVASGRDSGRGFRHDDTVELSERGAGVPGWRAFVREFELPPGVTQARVVVRDQATGAMGAVSQRFEVLPPGGLRLSTPILTDHVEPAHKAGGRPVPALAAHRAFRPGGSLSASSRCSARPPPPKGRPAWPRARGARRQRRPRPQGRPDADRRRCERPGGPARGMSLEGMAEGSYELVLNIRDETSGTHIERREPFTLAMEAAAPWRPAR